MKKLLASLALALMPLVSFATTFTEGTNYTVLPSNFTRHSEPSLTKVYSVYCGSCYRWDQQATDGIKAQMAEKGIEFRQMHIAYAAEFGDRVSEVLAAAQGTGKEQAVKDSLYESIQVNRIGDWNSDDQLFLSLEDTGLTQAEVDQRLKSPVVQQTVAKWKMYEETIPSIPSFVVNGKYLIKMESLESFDQFYAMVDYLKTL